MTATKLPPTPEGEPEEAEGYDNVGYLVLDVSHLAHRNAHALQRFVTADGRLSGHVYGAFKTLRGLSYAFKPRNFVFVYDRGASWRKDLVPGYKANRKVGGVDEATAPPPEGVFEVHEGPLVDFTPAPDVERLFRAFPGIHLSMKDMEADDMAAWFVNHMETDETRDGALVLYTGDRDYWQLINDENMVACLTSRKPKGQTKAKPKNFWIQEWQVEESLGVLPKHVSMLKAVLGDESDNVKGLEGGARPGKKDALKAFVKTTVAPVFFDITQPCPTLDMLPDWLQVPMREQRKRLAMNFQAMDLMSSIMRVKDDPREVITKGKLAEALGVLVEFECDSLLPMVEPLFNELSRSKTMPRPFG